MAATVLTEVDGSVGIVTLNRAERHNAFDETLIAELTAAFARMSADDAVRIVVLSATGRSFCAGADLDWMRRAASYTESENHADALRAARMLESVGRCAKPTLARVQGPAYGGGVGLVAACDIAIGTYDAMFSLSEVRLGIIPAMISPYVIAAVGARKAQRYMLTGERFSASEAYRIGLLHEIVPGIEELDEAVGEVVDALLAGSPQAQIACKDLVRAVSGRAVDAALIDETARRITSARASVDGREGVAAFLEKRRPAWSGHGNS